MDPHGARFLVIGCGSIGRRHLKNLQTLGVGEIVAYDPREDRRDEAAAAGARVVTSVQEAWDSRPDVVVVATPTALHVAPATEAVARGCHVLIEKPLSATADGIPELVEAARSAGVVGLVGCNFRFHPGARKLRRLIESGSIGRPVAATIRFGSYLPDWHPWEDYRDTYSARRDLGGGVLLDAIHEVDLGRWLFGPYRSVEGIVGRLGDLEVDTEDTVLAVAQFASGVVGVLHLDYLRRPPVRSCEVVGTDGTARWDYWSGVVEWSVRGGAWESDRDPVGWEANDMYLDELRHFFACLRGDEQPEQDLVAAADVLAVALSIRRSAAEGRRVELAAPGRSV